MRAVVIVLMGALATQAVACSFAPPSSPSQSKMESNMELAEAKRIAQTTERELAEIVPLPLVQSFEQQPKGSLMSCSDGGSHWAGHSKLTFLAPLDPGELFQSASEKWNGRPGWAADVGDTGVGSLRVIVQGPGTSSYILSMAPDGLTARISSMSPCVEVEPGEVRGPFY